MKDVYRNIAHALLIGLVSAGLFSAAVYISAAPPGSKYNPGETLNPSCAPGDTNCAVLLSSGNPFDQDLNTTDSVIFTDLTVGSVNYPNADPGTVNSVLITDGSGNIGFSSILRYPNGNAAVNFGSNGVVAFGGSGLATINDSGNLTASTITVGTSVFNANGSVSLDSTVGTNGQVLTSQGSGQRVVWADAPNPFDQDLNSSDSVTFAGIGVPGLINCDTIDTDGTGNFVCGFDAEGGDSPWTFDDFNGSLYSLNAGSSGANYLFSSGENAGNDAINADYSVFIGHDAGSGATNAAHSNFLGKSAGQGATNAARSNFFGVNAGNSATSASDSNFFGVDAGNGATGAHNSNFFSAEAGYNATSANNSNFFGVDAGNGATNANNSNFFGVEAGYNATSANNSNFFGVNAGDGASNATYSNFFGVNAGDGAYDANNSIFIGYFAGQGAGTASNSIFIGDYAGSGDSVDNTGGGSTSIAIGRYSGTGGYQDSIAIGRGVINSANNQVNIGNVLYLDSIYASDTRSSDPESIATVRIAGLYGLPGSGDAVGVDSSGYLYDRDASSLRYKTDIRPMNANFAKILEVDPQAFTYKATGDQSFGYIAEDFDSLGLKNLVNYDKEGLPNSIKYDRIPIYLLEVIKEQQREITALKLAIGLNEDGTAGEGWRQGSGNNSVVAGLTDLLASFNITFKNGITTIRNLTVGKVRVQKGMEMLDQETGDVYCTWISGGEWKKALGTCKEALAEEKEQSGDSPEGSIVQVSASVRDAAQAAKKAVEEAKEAVKEVKEAKTTAKEAKKTAEEALKAAKENNSGASSESPAPEPDELPQEPAQEVAEVREEPEPTEPVAEEALVETPAEEPPVVEVTGVISDLIKDSTSSLMQGVIKVLEYMFGDIFNGIKLISARGAEYAAASLSGASNYGSAALSSGSSGLIDAISSIFNRTR